MQDLEFHPIELLVYFEVIQSLWRLLRREELWPELCFKKPNPKVVNRNTEQRLIAWTWLRQDFPGFKACFHYLLGAGLSYLSILCLSFCICKMKIHNSHKCKRSRWALNMENTCTVLRRVFCCLVPKSCLTLTPWTVADQAPLSTGFSRQEH